MTEPTNIVPFRQPDAIDDPLTEVLRAGARQLLAQAIELEAAAFPASRDELRLRDGGRWQGFEPDPHTGVVAVAWRRADHRSAA